MESSLQKTFFSRFFPRLIDRSRGPTYSAVSTATRWASFPKLGSLITILTLAVAAHAGSIPLNFEGLPDSTIVTSQYTGLIFTNTIILSAGISLNEFEFPPHSGSNVIFDNQGPISITFAAPIVGFSVYVTHLETVSVQGYDLAQNLVAALSSPSFNNLALSGDPGTSPNELLTIIFGGGISTVRILGDPAGGSLVLDDVTFTSATSAVPEPNGCCYVVLGIGFMLVLNRLNKRQIRNPTTL
jgi:hypothetical protein